MAMEIFVPFELSRLVRYLSMGSWWLQPFSTFLKKYLVKLDHLPKKRGVVENTTFSYIYGTQAEGYKITANGCNEVHINKD